MRPSRYLLATAEPDDDVPTVRAYGDQDDHLRLAVLLAEAFGDRVDRGLRETCASPRASWHARKNALRGILEQAREAAKEEQQGGPFIRLVDPDALDMGEIKPIERWNDATFRRERSELFALLLDRIGDGGWELVRPAARESTSNKLEERDCELVDPPETRADTADERRLAVIADKWMVPALRPLADRLVANGVLRARALARVLEAASSAEDANIVILEMAYDVLSIDAVEAGKRLATLRGPQRWNGVAGAFMLVDDEGDWWEGDVGRVLRAAAQELASGGWLQIQGDPTGVQRFVMTRAARAFLAARATTTGSERVRREHEWLARRAPVDVSERVEVHYHAVESGDVDLATRTATHYAGDLRRIAYALSTKKDAAPGDFRDAARIYRRIVEDFDSEDAYAWEYFGYNLARQHRDERYPPGVEAEITRAYARASELEPHNPLYRGRELGFRARLGHGVMDDLRHGAHRFAKTSGENAQVIFIQRVLAGMRREARAMLAQEPWAAGLVQHRELRDYF